MDLQDLSDRYHKLADSIIERYGLKVVSEITFGMMQMENGDRVDAAFIELKIEDKKVGKLTSLDERVFSIDVESLILDLKNG